MSKRMPIEQWECLLLNLENARFEITRDDHHRNRRKDEYSAENYTFDRGTVHVHQTGRYDHRTEDIMDANIVVEAVYDHAPHLDKYIELGTDTPKAFYIAKLWRDQIKNAEEVEELEYNDLALENEGKGIKP